MHLWDPVDTDMMDSAVVGARSGGLQVVAVAGEAGLGKTSWLAELTVRAEGFAVLRAEGTQGVSTPYRVLNQWGVQVPRAAGGSRPEPFVAAQQLREVVDGAASGAAGVLLVLDDLQWADDESLESLTWLVQRAQGDRLLVAAAHRPLLGGQLPQWRRWSATDPRVRTVTLSGLSLAATAALVSDRHPQLSASDVERLWTHTGGNPLYLSALLAERTTPDLRTRALLPAPREYTHDVLERLNRVGHPAADLAEALAVLGADWVSVIDAAAVAGLQDGDAPVQALVDGDLIEVSSIGGPAQLRWVHALTRAAVYDGLPLARRRELHQAAASVTSGHISFEHQVAAADHYDDALAGELESSAESLTSQRSYRLAAQYLQWASALTSEADRRQDRWFDCLYAKLLDRDFDAVKAQLPDVQRAEPGRQALLRGGLESLQGRHRQGILELQRIEDLPDEATDPMTRYRSEALLAWSRTLVGADLQVIADGVRRARSLPVRDPGVERQLLLAEGHVSGRTAGYQPLVSRFSALAESPADVPDGLAPLLVWRGCERLARGAIDAAIQDFREVQRRQQEGVVDVLSSAFDALLGAAYWCRGEWNRSKVTFRRALDGPPQSVGVMTPALAALPYLSTGDTTTGGRLLDRGVAVLEELPWLEAVEMGLVVQVVQAHALGDRRRQARVMSDARRRWPHSDLGEGFNTGIWSAHMALAHLWAGELDQVEHQLQRAEALTPHTPGLLLVTGWVLALLDEARGQPARALTGLGAITAAGDGELPLYRAHALTDYARLAALSHRTREASAARNSAREIYVKLGAVPYLTDGEAPATAAGDDTEDTAPGYVLPLTERERDIVTLLVEGYSYAQISRELFITQSTVSYHLGNIYPKAGVRSRHELTDWVRRHPRSLAAAVPA